ncbi:MAG: ABC transporter permease subunit [Gemmatimonadetes bacterium]|nr:ABC transporter permease subunit [Gemmatimonadota bacterium]
MAISAALVTLAALAALAPVSAHAQDPIRVGSKNFTEGYILGELLAQALERDGIAVERRFGLGGTLVCYEALRNGEIDLYPEYSGTIEQAILKRETRSSFSDLQKIVRTETGLALFPSLGFDNTYAIAVRRETAASLSLASIGDLAAHPSLAIAFSHEFLNRQDGWPGLAARYGLPQKPAGIEHGLAYEAMRTRKLDATDCYSTDGDIQKYDLVLLADDRAYFPEYQAAPLVAPDVESRVRPALERLAGAIDEAAMQAMNGRVLLEDRTFAEVAHRFFETRAGRNEAGVSNADRAPARESRLDAVIRRGARHLQLTLVALSLGILAAVPLGVLIYRTRALARPVLYLAGLLQTIPSIALLAFMIPVLGIGFRPAIVALFLYALLPILRNTTAALLAIDPDLKRVARGIGLTAWQRLRHVEIPLAAPLILAGIKTAAVINIGTATLAAFIGAGGLGEPIVTGLALNDTSLILEGAIPAALLAILTELLFDLLENRIVPAHLKRDRALA